MSKRAQRNAEEAEILRKLYAQDDDTESSFPDSQDPTESVNGGNQDRTDKKEPLPESKSANDELRCPRCGAHLRNLTGCPHCGYRGYIPMSVNQTRRIKWILSPILLIAILLFLILRTQGVF